MKTILLPCCAAWLAISCTSGNQTNQSKGVLTDATMNTVTIVTEKSDTLQFSTMDADKEEIDGLLLGDTVEVFFQGKYRQGMQADKLISYPQERLVGGDRDEHDCIGSAGYTWSEVQKECIRLFEKGIRVAATDGSNRSAYIVFAPDSSRAELFFSDGLPNEILQRRRLPSGEHVWNVEDDDTKNIRQTDGQWTISQRGKLLFKEKGESAALGEMQQTTYQGLLPAASGPGIVYQLTIYNREHSGDGTFKLTLTYKEADNGKDKSFTYQGKRFTQRGIPGNNDATVWQCISDKGNETFNFLKENETTLTLLDQDFKKPQTSLNYSLTRKE